ncbi:MAG: tRNA (guanine-N(7)-)-methyltransferase (tRNA(m7G46)-methyltransferase) [Cirrosporium novae-zelandiae]|nr:MAG: tRNA (guanine-N(7)-)-methyltransferase (tRNA(m7G46)-methyltransferase) [Cirrosporium novae-zelandiae]
MDWTSYFPSHTTPSGSLTSPLQILDIGCGFGGLLLPLSTLFPHRLILGLELRSQVVEYAWTRILALRGGGQIQDSPETPQKEPQEQSQLPAQPQLEPPAQIQEDLILPSPSSSMLYTNIAALRTNAMKYLPNFIHRGTLTHIFICFPDPHFKARKHKARIVTNTLCSEYAYLLRPGGMACTITDVEELGGWMADKFRKHPLFEKVEEREYDGDGGDEGEGKENSPAQGDDKNNDDGMKVRECVDMMRTATEESKKVTRNGGKMFVSLWRRKQDPDWP